MPHFFFDLVSDGDTKPDCDGTELPTLDDARKEAGRCVGEMIRCASTVAPPRSLYMDIRDEDGHILMTLSFGVTERQAA